MPHPHSENWAVNYMEVYVDSTPSLYANGRQQVRVSLAVSAVDGQLAPPLTPTEVAGLKLVMYRNADQALPFDSFDELGWSASREYHGYDYFPGAKRDPHPDIDAVEYFSFWVACNQAADIGQTIRLAFMVTGDNGRRFCSNGQSWWPDGTPDPTRTFNKDFLHITVRRPEAYTLSNFILSPPADLPSTEPAAVGIFNQRCTLTLQVSATEQVGLKDMTVTPAGMISFGTPLPSDTIAAFTGYIKPGETQVHWNTPIQVPTGNLPLPIVNTPIERVGSLVLCGRIDVTQAPGKFSGPCTIELFDVFGTRHTLGVQFKPRSPGASAPAELELIPG